MNLCGLTKEALINYTVAQLANFFPDGHQKTERMLIENNIDEALLRLSVCINAVKIWEQGSFNYLHSSQYCTYLYYLSNSIWLNEENTSVPTKLFLLNKLLNGIDLFYEIKMPDIFLIGHSTGVVLAKASYSNYFVIHQNSTVGVNRGLSPTLGEGVIMYPNSAIVGGCRIGANSVIAQSVSVVSTDVAGDCLVFPGTSGAVAVKPLKRNILSDFFRG